MQSERNIGGRFPGCIVSSRHSLNVSTVRVIAGGSGRTLDNTGVDTLRQWRNEAVRRIRLKRPVDYGCTSVNGWLVSVQYDARNRWQPVEAVDACDLESGHENGRRSLCVSSPIRRAEFWTHSERHQYIISARPKRGGAVRGLWLERNRPSSPDVSVRHQSGKAVTRALW